MTFRQYALAVAIATLAICLMLACADKLGQTFRADAAVVCQEDAPCWNWATMGNHKRGIVTMSGVQRNVGPCMYARLYREGWVDRTSTPRLKGDGWARENGCMVAHYRTLND